MNSNTNKKIIHIDMDCFYAAIEIRDNSLLKEKPVAVGGAPNERGVICTCNYLARRYGVHAAMATSRAYQLCPDLIVLPVNMQKYRDSSKKILSICREFTELVEPLALDEAYLDVTDAPYLQGSATLIAREIQRKIWDAENLTASAGVAPNKFLAKVASGWKKPNGLFVIRPQDIENFVKTLPVDELYGVGKVTASKLRRLGLKTCLDLQTLSLDTLTERFGRLGTHLYKQCRGLDNREVQPNRIRKSLSIEHTFPHDVPDLEVCQHSINELYINLQKRIQISTPNREIKSQFVKIKFHDFTHTTAEMKSSQSDIENYRTLLSNAYARGEKPIRLVGLGVRFQH
jgi:DNA polymerase-4